ncbi:glutathione S-transferase [Arenimonas sp.]|uniref:glutathione S-transferase family protein n=1 Tax=Arenimonas sp. TaxID=1872635 RepID=UPI0025BAA66A|nr:glutathione S-transferase [Arenimonas sp.]
MVTVHHLENSRSQRVLWLLEELGVPYEVKRYARDPKTMLAPDALKKVHPLGKSPVITDGGVVVAESGAIIEYLADTHGKGRLLPPPGDPARRACTYWLHYAEGSLMPPLLMTLVFSKVRSSPMPFFAKPIARGIADKVMSSFVSPQLKLHFDYLEQALASSEWFAGPDFSVADIQLSFPIEAAAARGALGASRPKLAAFLAKIHARPAYQRALAKGGPYELMR